MLTCTHKPNQKQESKQQPPPNKNKQTTKVEYKANTFYMFRENTSSIIETCGRKQFNVYSSDFT